MNIETRISKIISYIFHPLLMPTYGILSILYTGNYVSRFVPDTYKWMILSVTFIFTFFLPVINAFILLKIGRINTIEMETSQERTVPYVGTALYYLALFYLLYNSPFPIIFQILVLGAAVSILFTLIITFRWKISAHAVAAGGIIGGLQGIIYRLQADMQLVLVLAIFCTGIVAYARLKLNAHTPAQVYVGVLLGFFVELLLMIFY